VKTGENTASKSGGQKKKKTVLNSVFSPHRRKKPLELSKGGRRKKKTRKKMEKDAKPKIRKEGKPARRVKPLAALWTWKEKELKSFARSKKGERGRFMKGKQGKNKPSSSGGQLNWVNSGRKRTPSALPRKQN